MSDFGPVELRAVDETGNPDAGCCENCNGWPTCECEFVGCVKGGPIYTTDSLDPQYTPHPERPS